MHSSHPIWATSHWSNCQTEVGSGTGTSTVYDEARRNIQTPGTKQVERCPEAKPLVNSVCGHSLRQARGRAADGLRQNEIFPLHKPATRLETESAGDSPLVSVKGRQQADPGRKSGHVRRSGGRPQLGEKEAGLIDSAPQQRRQLSVLGRTWARREQDAWRTKRTLELKKTERERNTT